MQNEYLEKVATLLKNKRAKAQILSELESHIEEKIDYYREIGYDEEESQRRALEEMGDPEETALSLNSLHNEKWYKIPFNIISLCVLAVIFMIMSFGVVNMDFTYDYTDTTHNFPHTITFDFLSCAIFAAFVVLLTLANRKNNKFVATAVFVFLVFVLAFSTLPFMKEIGYSFLETEYDDIGVFIILTRSFAAVFQPMLYMLFTICTGGIFAYKDSVFSYSRVDEFAMPVFAVFSFLIYFFLIAWSVIIFVKITKRERLKSERGLSKILKMLSKATAIFVTANVFLMSIFTVFALQSLEIKVSDNEALRKRMIGFVVNEDLSESENKILNDMENAGFKTKVRYDFIDRIHRYRENNNEIFLGGYDDEKYMMFDVYSSPENDSIPLNKYLRVPSDELKQFKTEGKAATLEEFMQSDVHDRAIGVMKDGNVVTFYFLTDDYYQALDTPYSGERLEFKKGVLRENTTLYDPFDDIEFYEEETVSIPDMTDIPSVLR